MFEKKGGAMFPGLIQGIRAIGGVVLVLGTGGAAHWISSCGHLPTPACTLIGGVAAMTIVGVLIHRHAKKCREEEEMAEAINDQYPGAFA